MTERVLTHRELNRAVLARQLLLERARLPIARAVERIGGIQNQYAPNGYIRLRSCVDGFERHDLTRALERKTVIQATLMRATIHIVSRRDYWPLVVAVRAAQKKWWLRIDRSRNERELEQLARRLRTLLESGPVTQKQLVEVAGRGWGGVGPWLDLVRVPPSGTWEQRRAHLYDLAERWVGPEDVGPDAALDHLVRRYLGGFGPAPSADIANWAHVAVRDLAPALERVQLRRFRDEHSRTLFDLPRAPLPHAETAAPVRFLPTWDATLLAHARRAGILPEEYRPRIFQTTNPQSESTFLVDGRVAGTWRYADGRIRLDPFERLPRQVRTELAEEGERLAELYADAAPTRSARST